MIGPRHFTIAVVCLASAIGCGSRTGMLVEDTDASVDARKPTPGACTTDAECVALGDVCNPVGCGPEKRCIDLPPKDCDDRDPCTADTCTGVAGTCGHTPVTNDVDRDGHRSPLPGHLPGDPGSCGDDCDDESPKAAPGNLEGCDGVDNDCNGVVDDGMRYVPADDAVDAIRLSGEIAPAEPAGIAWSGESYMTAYTGTVSSKLHVFSSRLSPDGSKLSPEARFTVTTADSSGGVLAWTGAEYGILWNDRRDDWETYFNRMSPTGEKLGPDQLVSAGDGTWSLANDMVWTGAEYVITYQDMGDLYPDFNLFAQRLDAAGKPIGSAVAIEKEQSESSSIGVGVGTLGIAWTHTEAGAHSVFFRVFDRALKPISKAVRLSTGGIAGQYPEVVWNRDHYVIVWADPDSSKHAVYGTTVDETGVIGIGARALTDSPKFSRYPTLRPLGDRLLLVWSDTKDGNKGYELYAKMLDTSLGSLDIERRITRAVGDSVFPTAAFGPTGDVGII
ncbi:MAG: putative metal-binding motif-containing protein, partial [Polyangiales bacterium]